MTRGRITLTSVSLAIGCVVLSASTRASSDPTYTAQPAPGAPAAAADADVNTPMTLMLMTVTGDLHYFAGQYVRIPTARVREVISPRVFTVEAAGSPRSYIRPDNRALVVLDAPAQGIEKGLVVEIIGRPWTFAGAQARLDRAWMDDLDEDERHDFARKAIIDADVVRLPGGIDLLAAPPSSPPRGARR